MTGSGADKGARPDRPSDVPWDRESGEHRPRMVEAESALPVALVVDGDGVSRRFVELTLSRSGKFAVETAKDPIGALEILRTSPIDLVISETDLTGMTGLQFQRRLSLERRLRNVPFVFLTADGRVTTKAEAFRAGADDYLTKPCDGAELTARLLNLVRRRARRHEALRSRQYTLAGDLKAMAIPELVNILEMGKRTGVLAVVTPRATSRVYFERGRIIHAVFGNLAGPTAFYRLMAEVSGAFEFSNGLPPQLDAGPRIHDTPTELLMEGARQVDDERVRRTPLASALARGQTGGRPASGSRGAPSAANAPTARLASQFERGIAGGFSLGELHLFSTAELASWTREQDGGERFHALLFADLAEGVSALMSLAEAPTERELLAGLAAEGKVLALSFFLPHERLLDVVLIDIQQPTGFERGLLRNPSLALVMPPEGEFLSVIDQARPQLDGLLGKQQPTAVLGVGNEVLESYLSQLACVRRGAALRCLRGSLGDGEDLRALLITGIRLWGSTAAGGRP